MFKTYTQSESERLIDENVLMSLYQQYRPAKEKPMSYANALSLLNELLDKKLEADNLDASKRRNFRTLSEFTLEHLGRVYGLKKMTYKALCALLPTLRGMYYEGHAYGVLFCRLLQVYDLQPIPDQLSPYLIKARAEFNKLSTSQATDKAKRASLSEAVSLVSSFFE